MLKYKIDSNTNAINLLIRNVWDIGKELSKKIGENIRIVYQPVDEYSIDLEAVVEIPRPCGCCKIITKDNLYPYDEDLKLVVSKIRIIENAVVDTLSDYDLMYDIYIPFTINEIKKIDIKILIKNTIKELINENEILY